MLPDKVLLNIWIYLEQPEQLAWTCKRFHALSKDTLWRTKWLMQRYEPYKVVFEAIARPRLFTAALFHELCKLGAPLTTNVVQLTYLLFNHVAKEKLWGGPVVWGAISFSSFSAVMRHAVYLVRTERERRIEEVLADEYRYVFLWFA